MTYRDRYDLKSLHVRAYLRTPVVADRWLPLDGILLYQAHRNLHGAQEVTISGAYTRQGISTLPLAIEHPGRRNWFYRCSWARWSHDVEGGDYWNKRFDSKYADLVDFGKRRGKVVVEQGRYKAYHMPIFYRSALWIEWFCVGDETEIRYLLSIVTHLGKKASQGWGRVYRWIVEPCDEDWSVWRENTLMRGIPVEDVIGSDRAYHIAHYGIRPSYWNRHNQMPLVVPDDA
jgi:CRISPR type IV-associated protein Csf3